MATFYNILRSSSLDPIIDEYLLSEEVRAQLPCENCKDWGRTLTEKDEGKVIPVFCPECKRPTWPNLGVNLPAGAATAIAGNVSAEFMRQGEKLRELNKIVEEAFKK